MEANTPQPQTLRALIHEQEVEAATNAASLVRDHSDAQEKAEEAARQVRMILYRAVIGELTRDERDHLLCILLPCCPQIVPDLSRLPTTDRNEDR